MIKTVRIKNFKALRDTGVLTLPELAVFIGNNGSGKSSVIEALRVIKTAKNGGLQKAFSVFGSMEAARHYDSQFPEVSITPLDFRRRFEPIEFEITATLNEQFFKYTLQLNTSEAGDLYLVEYEELMCDNEFVFEQKIIDNEGTALLQYKNKFSDLKSDTFHVKANKLCFEHFIDYETPAVATFSSFINSWQFLNLSVQSMGYPVEPDKIFNLLELKVDGRNIADFVRMLSQRDPNFLPLLISKMQFVLPYADTIRSNSGKGFKEEVILEMYEHHQKGDPIPGWLFSGGTLRILALLAVLNQPNLPSVLFVDEIENGLDPRTIGMLLNEIRTRVMNKEMQVVATTHSPYFLDLVELRHVIVAEKEGINTSFAYPDSDEKLTAWKKKFTAGSLYTSGRLTK